MTTEASNSVKLPEIASDSKSKFTIIPQIYAEKL